MIEFELGDVSRRIVSQLAATEEGEEAVILADPRNATVGRSLTTAARSVGAAASLLVVPEADTHGNEPTRVAAEAMAAADVAFTATTHSITHTHARLNASDQGTRVVVLRGVTEDLMLDGGINTDYQWLRERTAAVRDVLNAATEAHVTSPTGTDIRMDLTDRLAFSLDGFFHDYGFSALPPGESPTSPVEGSAEGTVVVDYSMDNVGLLEEPIELTFEDGRATTVEGGVGAGKLRELMDGVENAGNLAEFAIGTNPDARLVGNLAEDKKKLGTVHFAIGDNESLGGTVQCDIHLDGVVLNPTVVLDGETVLDQGTLRLERVKELAASARDRQPSG